MHPQYNNNMLVKINFKFKKEVGSGGKSLAHWMLPYRAWGARASLAVRFLVQDVPSSPAAQTQETT
jgi:hypothetical protein